MNLWQRLVYDWKRGNIIVQLIFANVAIFIVMNVVLGLIDLTPGLHVRETVYNWLSLPSDLNQFITQPWSLFTYGFLHKRLMHILFNMLWLYWIGSILVEYIGNRKVLPLFIYGIIAGGLLYLFILNIQGLENRTLIGASAGVMAVVWATVALLPDYRITLLFIGSIPLIYLAAFMSILDLLTISNGFGGGFNAGGAVAHIGGALMGYSYIKLYQRGVDLSIGFNRMVDWLSSIFQPRKREKVRVSYRNSNDSQKKRTASGESTQNDDQLNAILDKISEKGYDSLTQQEKQFLFKRSE